MKKRLIILLAAAITLPAIASAAPARPGAYVSGFIGVNSARDADITGFDFSGTKQLDDRVEFDPGVFVGGTGGYDFGIIRLEGELSYKHSEIKSVTDNLAAPPVHYRDVDGDLGVVAFMANAFFDLHNDSPITPYWGAGIGFANLHLSNTHANGLSSPLYREDDASVFAYQAGAGLEIAINRRLSLDLGYRYFRTAKAEFDHDKQFNNSTAEMTYESHNGAVGLRVKF